VTTAGYLRFPHLNDDLLTFVAEDDVWLAPLAGGRAWRVTADQGEASYPRISPDGALIAWTSKRDGPPEIYLTGTGGGPDRRLTYWSDLATRTCGWSPDGEVLGVTAAGQPFARSTWAHALPVTASAAARRLGYGPVGDIAVDRGAVALLNGTTGRDPAFWKRYRGGTSGRLWVSAQDSGAQAGQNSAPFRRVLADVRGQFFSPMLVGGRLAFLSDHEGTGNVYSCALDGSDLRRHTHHDGFYARNASTDGSRITYQCAGDIWLLDDLTGAQPRQAEVTLGSPAAPRAARLISAQDHLGDLSCDASGQASAVEIRGTVHWLAHRDGPARALSVVQGTRARMPRVLGTAGQVVWVTDAEGEDALEISGSAAGTEPRRLASGAIGRVYGLAAAPDGSAVAAAAHDGRLLLVDVHSGEVTELARSDNGEVTGLAWSPDSAWLAWSQPCDPHEVPLSQIRLARLADREIVDATDGRFSDTEPAFTLDGRYLAFLSRRNFDPVYDAHVFDLSFPFGSRPYLIPLAASTPSPFDPVLGGRPPGGEDAARPSGDTGAAAGQQGGDSGGTSASSAADPAARPAVTVDVDDLAGRVVQVPVPESRYSSLRAVKDGLAWLREPLTGNLGEGGAHSGDAAPRAALEYFDLGRRRCTELQAELDWFAASGDGTRLVISDHGTVTVVPADHKADPDDAAERVQVDLSRARFMAEPPALWSDSFAEAGRIVRHDFWVPDLAEVDWSGVLDSYRPLLGRIAGQSDFTDLLWEILGELGASHGYARQVPRPGADSAEAQAVGLLGADLEADDAGAWRIVRVVPGDSSDPRARSPLAAPGTGIGEGDVVLAVDGQQVDPQAGPGPLLAGSAGKPAELTIAPAAGGEPRRIAVVPLKDERQLRYLDWVAGRRQLVRELSGGKIGYLHVPDMMSGGWADFHRDLRGEMIFDALIIDVRSNRGGHTSQLVVEKLARRVIAWSVPRGLQATSYPLDAPRGPVVALADEQAGSDGDVVTAAIRTLGLGPVVGTRTWGGVIGIDEWHELVDGSAITVPRYAFWFSEFGWGVENYGVDPDIEVVLSPDDWAAGNDTQLSTAVTVALEALAARPSAAAPPTTDRPSRRRPPLPPHQHG
jgi:tricorn protease